MKAESLIFRKLTPNEFKAITNTINSEGGGSQTYIDFPKGSISDDEFKEFFGNNGTPNTNGFEWVFYVNSLSIGRNQQREIISARRDSSNSLREQNNENRIEIWKNEKSGFPNDGYDEKNNPIIIFILKSDDGEFWAGWFYRNECTDNWPMNIGLSTMFWKDCAYIHFDSPIDFDIHDFRWPFFKQSKDVEILSSSDKPHQQIFFGAPGTGKSQAILRQTKGCNTIRTTFHPDSDYSTFVGCYKPTTDPVYDKNGHPTTEEKITYSYSEQAFLQAYLNAWKAMEEPEPKPQFLIIEEINRGNCAQIFGDLFQLLDRKCGYSEYPIDADSDLRKQLAKKFKTITIAKELEDEINAIFIEHYPDGIVKKIKDGELLLLPKNLYIWATMNTSDQSLFPIDSAFKRRWQWRYVKISKGIDETTKLPLNWTIDFDYKEKETAKHYSKDWWEFIKSINEKIAVADSSDDKKLGYFFCKPTKGTSIDAETFVSKVIFYLWTDVFKDNDNELFRIEGEPSFDLFYKIDEEGRTIVNTSVLYQFMQKVFEGKAESGTGEQEQTSEDE